MKRTASRLFMYFFILFFNISIAQSINIGDSYKGGIVAYIYQPRDPGFVDGEIHGMIAAKNDQTTSYGCGYAAIYGASGTVLGTGKINTDVISKKVGITPGIAAKICNDLELNGFDDWYLPSKDELNKLFLNRKAIGNFDENNAFYWSSSTINGEFTWIQNLTGGYQKQEHCENNTNFVRAIRNF